MSDSLRKIFGTDLTARLLGANPFFIDEPNHTKWSSLFLRASEKCEPVAARISDYKAEHGESTQIESAILEHAYALAFDVCAEVLLDLIDDSAVLANYQEWVKALVRRTCRAFEKDLPNLISGLTAPALSDRLTLEHLPRWLEEARVRARSADLARSFTHGVDRSAEQGGVTTNLDQTEIPPSVKKLEDPRSEQSSDFHPVLSSETSLTNEDAGTTTQEVVLTAGRLLLMPATRQLLIHKGKKERITITKQQVQILQALFEMAADGIVEPPTKEVLKRARIPPRAANTKTSDLFQSRPGIWGKIVKSGKRGTIRLVT